LRLSARTPRCCRFHPTSTPSKIVDDYDARGREKHHYWLDANGYVDPATPAINSRWDDASRLTRTWNNFSIVDYIYDEAGQVRTEGTTVTGDDVAREVRYCRYPSGDVSQITYPNGSTVVNRFYTARGQLKGVGWAGNMSTSYVYLHDGKVDYQARANHITTSYGYDGRGIISSVRHSNDLSGRDLARRDYWRDDRDRILGWKRGSDTFHNGMEDGRGNRYGYDDEGQLTSASYRMATPDTSPGPPQRSDIFQYDKLGNRMGSNYVASRGAMNFTRKDNGLNQYSGWWPYSATTYDDDAGGSWGAPQHGNGVLMMDGWITAGFNALNQPICMWSPMYTGGTSSNWMWFGYDPLGRCVKRWVGPRAGTPPYQYAPPANTNPATYYYYDGWNMVQEGPSGGTDRVYVHGGRVDEVVASQAGGVWSYHQYDAQGNCILLTDTNGGIREQYDYDAFGMPYVYNATGARIGGSAQWGNRFLFTGREWLKDLKVYDYRNRIYQPELGRFLQPDPQEFEAGDYNLYRYCHNDPVNGSDPMGLLGLTSEGAGDWCWFNGEVAEDQRKQQQADAQQAAAPLAPAVVSGNEPAQTGANIPTRVNIEHDESFEITKDNIYVTDNDGNKVLANAKTYRHLESPEATIGEDGKIDYTQHVTAKTTFKADGPYEYVEREWTRVEGVREEVRQLKSEAKFAARQGFKSAEEAKQQLGRLTEKHWNRYKLDSSGRIEVINGGK